MNHPGNRLRLLREHLGFTLRDVETNSTRIAEKHKNEEYAIPLSRLSDIETKGVLPSIFRLYSLAVIYRHDYAELLSWFGIELNTISKDLSLSEPTLTHRLEAVSTVAKIPTKMDPSFDLRRTTNLGRIIEKWGVVPLSEIQKLSTKDFTYAYVGTDDYTMYPLLLPGAFVQVDETLNEVVEGAWRAEYERPIYFVETRDGYICSWCSIKGEAIILQPHPLSPVQVRVLRREQEAEIIGQVVGMAMRLDEFTAPEKLPAPKGPAKLN